MKKTKKSDLQKECIHFTEFRLQNNISQKDLAKYLGVSSSFISLVEAGKTSLPDNFIDKLYENPFHWNANALIPEWFRINQVLMYINETRNAQRKSEGLAPQFFHVEKELLQSIKHGLAKIPEHLAEEIILKFPEINKDWILTGAGKMVLTVDLKLTVLELERKIDRLTAELQGYKTIFHKIAKAFVEAFESTDK